MTERITARQFYEADGVEDWCVVGEGACTYLRTGSFAAGDRLVHAISQLAGLEDHHPDLDLRSEGVTVRLITITHDYYGLSERDVELARQISAAARARRPRRPLRRADRPSHDRRARPSRGDAVLACRTRLRGPR